MRGKEETRPADGASPSGKAAAFGAAIRWFESNRPSQYPDYSSTQSLFRMRVSVENTPAEIGSDSIAKAVNAAGNLIASDVREFRVKFVTPKQIANLQFEFKGQPGPTNILTFVSPTGADIAICPQIAAEDAVARGWSLECELAYLAVHGALHALGFDHDESSGAERMRELELQALASFGIDPLPLGAV